MKTKIITNKEAIDSLPDREIIHCFAGGIGADWDKEDVIKEINMAQKIAWIDDMFGHDLAMEAGKGSNWFNRSVLRFDIKKPELLDIQL